MRTRIRMAAIATAFLAGTAGAAYAQGSMTQDPGRMAPRNLTLDRLGPSSGSPSAGVNGRLGAGDLPNGSWSEMTFPSARNSAPTAGSGGTTVFHGTPGAYGSSYPAGYPARPWPLPVPPSRGGNP